MQRAETTSSSSGESLRAVPEPDHIDATRHTLDWAMRAFGETVVIASSLGPQSLVVIDLLRREGHDIRVLFLDTGFHFADTIQFRKRVESYFRMRIESVEPKQSVEEMEREHGQDLWKQNPSKCCQMRKVDPLRLALAGASAWITGIRRGHSASRSQAATVEWDHQYGLTKINPLVAWSREQVISYLNDHGIPTNPLLTDGYPSVGCQPCTRRVDPATSAQDERAGRWSGIEKNECGLHFGTVPRA